MSTELPRWGETWEPERWPLVERWSIVVKALDRTWRPVEATSDQRERRFEWYDPEAPVGALQEVCCDTFYVGGAHPWAFQVTMVVNEQDSPVVYTVLRKRTTSRTAARHGASTKANQFLLRCRSMTEPPARIGGPLSDRLLEDMFFMWLYSYNAFRSGPRAADTIALFNPDPGRLRELIAYCEREGADPSNPTQTHHRHAAQSLRRLLMAEKPTEPDTPHQP